MPGPSVRDVMVTVLGALAAACASSPTETTPPPTHPQGVVADSLPVPLRPFGIAISRKDVVYVTQLDAAAITVANADSMFLVREITVGSTPTGVTFDPTGSTAYVTNQLSDNVGVVNVATFTQVHTIHVTGDPFAVITSPDGARVFASTNANSVFRLDPAAGTVTGSANSYGAASTMTMNPAGTLLYASVPFGGAVVVLNPSTMAVVDTLPIGGKPQGLAVSPDGTLLYVANEFGWLSTWRVAPTVAAVDSTPLPGDGFGLAMTPDAAQLYITLLGGQVAVVDRATHQIVKTITTGGVPRRIAFTADGKTAAVANEAGYLTFIR